MFEQFTQPQEKRELSPVFKHTADEFLNDQASRVPQEEINNALYFAEHEFKPLLSHRLEHNKSTHEISFDKYKKTFNVNGGAISPGEIIASRHFTSDISLPNTLKQSGAGKNLIEKYVQYSTNDVLTESLNKILAGNLARTTQKQDMLKSKAYQEIEHRSGTSSEQLGVIAEKLMIGVAEMVSINRPDLHIAVRPGNAYEDVQEKIDFIIDVKSVRRGVGIETSDTTFDEKHFGIQFTINSAKHDAKKEQIEKSKNRGADIDDILLITMDQEMIRKAITAWKTKGSPLHGPWAEFSQESKQKILTTLFENILSEKELGSITK